MKKTLFLILALLFALGLAACSEPGASSASTASGTGSTSTNTTTSTDSGTSSTTSTAAPHVHSFGQWAVTVAPTCTTPGEEIRTCDCGFEEIRTLDAAGHDYVETDRVNPTPSDPDGNIAYTCTVCAHDYEQGMEIEGSRGLDYVVLTQAMYDSPNNNGMMCKIVGIGSCTDSALVIPKYIDGYEVIMIGKQAFFDCATITSVQSPDSILFIEDSAFKDCMSLRSVSMQSGVLTIGSEAFHWCLALTDITLPETLQSIGDMAFRGCSFKSIVIPDSVIFIDMFAFEACDSMTSVTLDKGLAHIPYGMFTFCSSLTSVTIPDGVTEIGDDAFSYCQGLVSVTIPSSVTRIGDGAFSNCSHLKEIHFQGTMQQWNSIPKGTGFWVWDDYTGYYTVYCTDGELTKSDGLK